MTSSFQLRYNYTFTKHEEAEAQCSVVISNREVGSFFSVFYYVVPSGKNVLEMD